MTDYIQLILLPIIIIVYCCAVAVYTVHAGTNTIETYYKQCAFVRLIIKAIMTYSVLDDDIFSFISSSFGIFSS